LRPAHVRASEVRVIDHYASKIGVTKISFAQISTGEICVTQIGPSEIR
jgi:hypothetical protein